MVLSEYRFLEWKALLDFCRENEKELMEKGRMRALVFCLQRHWQDMRRLKVIEAQMAIQAILRR